MLHLLPLSAVLSTAVVAACWAASRYRVAKRRFSNGQLGHIRRPRRFLGDLSDLGYALSPTHVTRRRGAVMPVAEPDGQSANAYFEDTAEVLPQWVALHIMAPPGQPFVGYELFQTLVSCDLVAGDDQTFHYYMDHHGKKTTLFTVANACKPGTFDLESMGSLSCPGLLLLWQPARHDMDLEVGWEAFMTKARHLEDELAGQLCDEHRHVLTDAKLDALWQGLVAKETV